MTKKDLIKKLDSIDLDSKNSQELLALLHRPFLAVPLTAKNCTWIVTKFQKKVGKTLWAKFPEAAKKSANEGIVLLGEIA